MGLIDLILNLAGLLLWLHWRSVRSDPLLRSQPATLVGTLKRAEPRRLKHWQVLLALTALILVRAWVYYQIGSAAGWTPRLHLGMVVLAFRSDVFGLSLLYSGLSFVRALLVLYTWLIALTLVNLAVANSDPLQRVIRLQLGRTARWPWPILLLLPLVLTALLWAVFHPLLARAGVINPAQSLAHLAGQGLLVGVSPYFTLKYLFPAILLVYLIINYVYLGASPLWDFITVTARHLLRFLDWLPLRIGRADFAPVVGAVLILLLLDALPNYLLTRYPDFVRRLWPH